MSRRRLPLHLIISLAVLSAPAWAAAQSACASPTRVSCCCPQSPSHQPCKMQCSDQPAAADSVALMPAPVSLLKAAYALQPTAPSATALGTPIVLAAAPLHSSAPPLKRYLLACVFRL